MKNLLLILLVLTLTSSSKKQTLKPYVHGSNTTTSISETRTLLKKNLKTQGFTVLGEYSPAKDKNRWLMVITSNDLKAAAKQIGGLRAYGSILRLAITKEGGTTKVSFTNPYYWGNAYFQKDFAKVKSLYTKSFQKLMGVMKKTGTYVGKYFGSKEGLSIKDLQEYQYMMGMPELDDVVVLKSFRSYKEAVTKVDANLTKGVKNLKKIYSIELPGKNVKLYGIALSGKNGESSFLPTIDISNPKHTAFLPYEILVKGKDVIMLHGRYRIALAFPDLTMGTFTKIMSTPGNIEELMETACK